MMLAGGAAPGCLAAVPPTAGDLAGSWWLRGGNTEAAGAGRAAPFSTGDDPRTPSQRRRTAVAPGAATRGRLAMVT